MIRNLESVSPFLKQIYAFSICDYIWYYFSNDRREFESMSWTARNNKNFFIFWINPIKYKLLGFSDCVETLIKLVNLFELVFEQLFSNFLVLFLNFFGQSLLILDMINLIRSQMSGNLEP